MSDNILKLKDFLPFRLSVASNLVSRGIARIYEDEFGLTMTQWRIMAVLGGEEGLTAKELTALTALDKTAISRAASALVDRGLVARQAAPSDKRSVALSLSADGRAVYEKVMPRARAWERELAESLGEAEAALLSRALERVIETARRR
jgi:DNA-binding MarR family transcriptional regulator